MYVAHLGGRETHAELIRKSRRRGPSWIGHNGKYNIKMHSKESGQDSIVSIVSHCGLDGPRIKSQVGQNFPHPSRLPLGPTQPPVWWVPGLFSGVKRPGHGIDHPLPSNAKVNERVEIYFYPPSGPSCWFIWWNLPYFEESVWGYGLDTTFSYYASVVGYYERSSESMARLESKKLYH
jgi:hypothetical protein